LYFVIANSRRQSMLYRIAQKIRSLYWRIFQPSTFGVKAAVFNRSGDILLVRLSYHDGWYLPGGGIGRRETEQGALARELREEVGVRNFDKLEIFARYLNKKEGKKDHVVVFKLVTDETPKPSMGEVVDARFFPARSRPRIPLRQQCADSESCWKISQFLESGDDGLGRFGQRNDGVI
jgi:ADP-ribose pyrophosphatase YjhB (NUDIX family)